MTDTEQQTLFTTPRRYGLDPESREASRRGLAKARAALDAAIKAATDLDPDDCTPAA